MWEWLSDPVVITSIVSIISAVTSGSLVSLVTIWHLRKKRMREETEHLIERVFLPITREMLTNMRKLIMQMLLLSPPQKVPTFAIENIEPLFERFLCLDTNAWESRMGGKYRLIEPLKLRNDLATFYEAWIKTYNDMLRFYMQSLMYYNKVLLESPTGPKVKTASKFVTGLTLEQILEEFVNYEHERLTKQLEIISEMREDLHDLCKNFGMFFKVLSDVTIKRMNMKEIRSILREYKGIITPEVSQKNEKYFEKWVKTFVRK